MLRKHRTLLALTELILSPLRKHWRPLLLTDLSSGPLFDLAGNKGYCLAALLAIEANKADDDRRHQQGE